MLSRQRSTCFLLENPRVQGSDFVGMLSLIGYPGAGKLKGEDFDWLCETEEAGQFLAWLCGTVDQRNSLSDEQLEAYQALLASGQPMLGADELQSLCVGGVEDNSDLEMCNEQSLEELEEELQKLQSLRNHRVQRLNKMESLRFSLLRNRASLENWEKEEEKRLSHVKERLKVMSSQDNAALSRIRETTTKLKQLYTASSPPYPFLSSLNLEQHIGLEEASWEKVEQWAKESHPMKKEDVEAKKRTLKEMEEETVRLRTAWMSQRMPLSIARADLSGKEEALRWLESRGEEQIYDLLKIQSMERDIHSLEAEVTTLKNVQLPALLHDLSLGPCLPAYKRKLEMDDQILKRAEQVQEPVSRMAMHQMSRLQLLEIGMQVEMRQHQQTQTNFRELKDKMEYRAEEMERRMLGLRCSSQWLPPIRIDSKDQTSVRLSLMLPDPANQSELFPKYETLQRRAMYFFQEIMSLKNRLQRPLTHQTEILEQACKDLLQSLCRGTRNLQRREPSLTLAFEDLSSTVSQFNQWCHDCLRDLEQKRRTVQTSQLEKERRLYVLFYRNSSQLVRAVQDLEKRARDMCKRD
ncbi:HAUS augmin-like complex subunit 3 [Bombina bombina]|uniref:HAUS augmin-like complex subunit 3 n=1 Tax=Bombina bombina TaxID=8345 RepID=UPI00235A8084|nr:HAUS augmin-like complex subunit 3 [Bombina bombina]